MLSTAKSNRLKISNGVPALDGIIFIVFVLEMVNKLLELIISKTIILEVPNIVCNHSMNK